MFGRGRALVALAYHPGGELRVGLPDLLAHRAAVDGPVRVVGHDWGGAITWLLATRHPERVERAVVIACATVFPRLLIVVTAIDPISAVIPAPTRPATSRR